MWTGWDGKNSHRLEGNDSRTASIMVDGKAKKVCLIQPPASYENSQCCLPTGYIGVGLLALSGFLESNGHRTRILHIPNAIEEGHSFMRVLQEISVFDPDIIAIGLNWVHFSIGALETAAKIKRRFPGLPVILGGQHAGLFAEEIMCDYSRDIDALIIGEAEIPLLRICESSTNEIPDGIPGVMTKNNCDGARGAELIENIDELPLQTYKRLWPSYERPLAAISTMRGACPRGCAFCLEGCESAAWKGHRLRLHSIDHIARQIGRFHEEGKTIITIQDQFYLRGDGGALELSEALSEYGLGLEEMNIFAEQGSFGACGLEALSSLASTVSLDYGVETGCASVADISGIRFKMSGLLDAVKKTVAAGVFPYTWWMVGFPGEGMDELAETRDFIIETMSEGAIPRWVTPLVLFPQTRMAASASQYGVKPLLSTFKDFSRFSVETSNEYGWYSSLATHSTLQLAAAAISAAAVDIKKAIMEKWHILDAFYKRHPKLRDKYFSRGIMLGSQRETHFTKNSFF